MRTHLGKEIAFAHGHVTGAHYGGAKLSPQNGLTAGKVPHTPTVGKSVCKFYTVIFARSVNFTRKFYTILPLAIFGPNL